MLSWISVFDIILMRIVLGLNIKVNRNGPHSDQNGKGLMQPDQTYESERDELTSLLDGRKAQEDEPLCFAELNESTSMLNPIESNQFF